MLVNLNLIEIVYIANLKFFCNQPMRLFKYIAVLIIFFGLLKAPGVFFGKPLPASVLEIYFLFASVVAFLAMTVTNDGADAMFKPLISICYDPSRTSSRKVVMVIIPLSVAWITYSALRDDVAPPPAVRSLHPSPPTVFTAYNRTIELAGLENPYRDLEKADPSAFRGLVLEGGEIYFKNCAYCHGAKLDGAGQYASGLTPLPLPFKGTDTIAQLQESYVFWRIVKGGRSLSAEGAPWLSSMPAWELILTEDEVWKTTLFIYAYTGNRPRSWKR